MSSSLLWAIIEDRLEVISLPIADANMGAGDVFYQGQQVLCCHRLENGLYSLIAFNFDTLLADTVLVSGNTEVTIEVIKN
ncbi:MAG: hypothetical protein OHK0046_47540 [Anaerolineae bacterium]